MWRRLTSFVFIWGSYHKVVHSLAMQEVNPWEVKGDADGKIDYEKLQKKVHAPSSDGEQ